MCFDGAAQKGLALHQAEGLRCRGTRSHFSERGGANFRLGPCLPLFDAFQSTTTSIVATRCLGLLLPSIGSRDSEKPVTQTVMTNGLDIAKYE